MAFDKLTEYSATNASNTSVGDVDVTEGMLPSNVNNAIRELMTHQKEAFGSGTPLYVDQTNNRVGIGSASPDALLQIEKSDSGTTIDKEPSSQSGPNIAIHNSNQTANNLSSVQFTNRGTNGVAETATAGIHVKHEAQGGTYSYGSMNFNTTNSAGSYATRMNIQSDGKVGVNCTPDATFKVVSSGANLIVGFNGTQNYFDASENIFRNFAGSERSRIDSSGNHNFNYTGFDAGLGNTTTGVSIRSDNIVAISSASGYVSVNRNSDGTVQQFNRSGNTKGTITINSSGTTYNTTSDIRLKQDIEPLQATDKLMQMNPVSYSWKADPDGPRSMGFIAQEMQEVMPEAVSTGDDDDAMMSMDYGRITPILVSALQDAHRKIEELAAEIAELKAT